MRNVICGDAGAYLRSHDTPTDASFVTSLPDVSELRGQTLDAWRAWFIDTVALVAAKSAANGVAIFFQTDVFRNGQWIDKSYLCHQGAERAGARLLWHKIVCRVPAGSVADGRPGYAHMLCFARELPMTSGFTPDVIPDLGSMDWSKAMGRNACVAACEWIRDHTETRTIIDPFCGTGTVLAVANELGLEALGIEIDEARAERARRKK
ncbi:MAG: SAM-dependent methyltransferase [Sandaracinaceae bacterium]|nr:SAM-dependent methyltransferase [Sandaracinaceae bacterium]